MTRHPRAPLPAPSPPRHRLGPRTLLPGLAALLLGSPGEAAPAPPGPSPVQTAGNVSPADAVPGASAPRTTTEVVLREGTNLAAAASPARDEIALGLHGRIWLVPGAGGEARALTPAGGDAWEPAWSPDGERIAFHAYLDGTYQIWTVSRDGGDLQALTGGPWDHREPHWSPDGARIAFASDRGEAGYDIWVVEVEGGELRRVTEEPGEAYGPAWSPDGREIAFISQRAGERGIRAVTVEGDGREVARVPDGTPFAPAWSPGGEEIVFPVIGSGWTELRAVPGTVADGDGAAVRVLSRPDEDVFPFRVTWRDDGRILHGSDGRIRERSPDGGDVREIPFRARVTLDRRGYAPRLRDFDEAGPHPVKGIVSPAVSPDGERIAFGALGDLWILEIGGEARPVTRDPYLAVDPAWSPDGSRVVFSTDRTGVMDLWTRDLETGSDRRLTELPSGDLEPAWSPDGSRIAFLSHGEGVSGVALRIVEVETGRVDTLRDGLFRPGAPTWSPDGRRIALVLLEPYSSRFREGLNQVVVLAAEDGREVGTIPEASPATREIHGPVWSPDGRWLAFASDGFLRAVPVDARGTALGPPVRLANRIAASPSWTGDSEAVIYLSADRLERVRISDGRVDPIPLPLTWERDLPGERIVIHAGTVFDGRSPDALRNVDVIVEGHRIVRVAPHDPANHEGARVVDASDATVIPGLIEMHAHHRKAWGEPLGRLWLSWGVTTVREPLGIPYESLEWREAVESGARTGPRLFTSGHALDGSRIYYSHNLSVRSAAHLELLLELAERLDYDLIKTYVRLPNDLQRRAVELAHARGIPLTSHELYPAAAFGMDGVEHIGGTSRRGYNPKISRLSRSYDDVVALLAGSGMTFTPTVSLSGGFRLATGRDPALLDDPRFLAFLPESEVALHRDRARAAADDEGLAERVGRIATTGRRVVEAGGNVAAGTDSPLIPYGLSLHLELATLVEDGGMTPYDALRAATSTAADAMGMGHELGAVRAGHLADLLILDGNPLEDIRNTLELRAVVANGRVHRVDDLLERP